MPRHHNWNAPASLYVWPAAEGGEEDQRFPTLREALQAALDGDLGTAWIVTQNGDILTPGLIAELRDDMTVMRRKRSVSALFGWARAA